MHTTMHRSQLFFVFFLHLADFCNAPMVYVHQVA